MNFLTQLFVPLFIISMATPTRAGESPPYAEHYLAIQEALSGDQLPDAQAAAARLEKSIRDQKILANQARQIKVASDLEEARKAFKALSETLIAKSKGALGPASEVVSCSMAKARWIQKKGKIRNPYYGKSMLTCGEKS